VKVTVLYDGWSLIYQPFSPSALHLLAILEHLPGDVDGYVALPAEPPDWIPKRMAPVLQPTGDSPGNRLRWEQRILPRLAKELPVDLIHITTPNPPLFSSGKAIVSPAGYGDFQRKRGFTRRLREAISQGGMTRANSLIWPVDLPTPEVTIPVSRLPAIVYGEGITKDGASSEIHYDMELPETFILCHGPAHPGVLLRAMSAWSWAAAAIGEYNPLLLLVQENQADGVNELARAHGLGRSVRVLSPSSPRSLVPLYARCAALFHPASVSPWGGPIRRAMFFAKPVVAMESPIADAMVGAGAFLVNRDDLRAVGAALITVVVDEVVAENLSQAGRERAMAWNQAAYGGELLGVYQDVLSIR
jgi:hypothetical protein